ncbi:hypothetical protein SAMN03159476_00401 [Pseudomonas sp. NFPP05]|uniref:hypothetical protein n=1 Tax=unclassified Pseudomonas TaxID=196821 RepID=UPI000888869F|nr:MULTISPECIES: hypothetical protein [unclassified Pseudomonas]SDA11212.1 hypothetical protein SAMN03159465_00401 [Pseudomonas sp. NFPP12]SFM12371.1 hypothetical protein SAMN03159476_00401 [Pseudomonas sp. NFPP05]
MSTQTYKVEAPDGQIITLEGPAGASQEEVISQAKKLYSQRASTQAAEEPRAQMLPPAEQEDPRAARAMAAMDQYPTGAPAQPEEPGLLDKLGTMLTGSDRQTRATQELPELQNSGLLNGLDIPSGKGAAVAAAMATMTNPEEIAQTLKSLSPQIGIQQDEKGNLIAANNATGARAVINKPGFTGMDALQALGLGAAFTPAGRGAAMAGGGIARQAVALGAGSALTQAAIEGGQAAAGGEFNPEDVALAGATGAAVPAVTGTIGAGVDVARRGVAALRGEAGGAAPIVQAANANNIPLMTSDIAPPRTPIGQLAQRTGERIPYAGTGALRAQQQEARAAAIQQLGERYPTPAPNQIIDSLRARTDQVRRAAGDRLQQYEQQLTRVGEVPYPRTQQSIEDAVQELSRPGVVQSPEALAELQGFARTLGEAPQTYGTLRENRTALREIVNGFDSPMRSQLPSRARALLTRVQSSLTQDMQDVARSNLSPRDYGRLQQANAVYAREADLLQNTRLKNVLDKGDLTPEVAEHLLFSKKASEVRNLYRSLDTNGRQAARATLIQKAIRDSGGVENISPDRFANNMRRLQTQSGIVFRGDELAQLRGLEQVLNATRRAGQIGITSTGQEGTVPVMAAAAGSAIGSFGGTLATAGAIGGAARAYESAAVRNALIRIGNAPRSTASRDLALRLARDLNAGVQSARAQEPGEEQTQ